MEWTINYYILFLLLTHFLCSVYSETNNPISSTEKDITTPITTIPNVVPTSPTILNPNSNPDTYSPSTSTSNSPVSSGSSWCIASPSSSQRALQIALDYACGFGGTDCSAIQVGGSCYNPNSVHDHASFAFNKYYQKNPVPNSCNFGGTAVITNTNPSVGTCQYPSTSTSSSVLNITNTSGANVFGYVPVPTNPSSASAGAVSPNTFAQICFILCAIAILENKYIQHE
ncbi:PLASMODESMATA CALLOSE-BINDING PROTEIN 2-like [Vicia villosa]|uniref:PLASMODESMATA CALLOSE-BINDING PROTEIN 2-like n=1 Tax=Vicia villosa TaxID=3911 RepID=UPI00273A8975|nr:PLASMODESMATA CALLOSE-BINDING PROTEIN 2-like [Vicia villosa]